MFGNEEFYLNDKLVSIHLYFMEEYDEYDYIDNFEYTTAFLGRKKQIKFDNKKWISKEERRWYPIEQICLSFNTDEDLLNFINPIGVPKYIIRNEKLYKAPKIIFRYVNGDERVKYFEKNSEAETYYISLKTEFNEEDYIVFD